LELAREADFTKITSPMTKHFLSFFTVVLTLVNSVRAAESWWPQFRGPNGSGISESAKPPTVFAPGTNQLWKIPVPAGMSSPSVTRDWIFLTAFEDEKLATLCYARRDGKLFWKADAKAEKIEEFNASEGSPAASTVATDGKSVVSYFGSCGLICYDVKGKELWRHALPTAQTAGSFGTGGCGGREGNELRVLPQVSPSAFAWRAGRVVECGSVDVVCKTTLARGGVESRHVSSSFAVRFAWLARTVGCRFVADLLWRTAIPSSHLDLERPMEIGRLAKPDHFSGAVQRSDLDCVEARALICGSVQPTTRWRGGGGVA
jgi:hypothetical protein